MLLIIVVMAKESEDRWMLKTKTTQTTIKVIKMIA
jgi:hypothetical protein